MTEEEKRCIVLTAYQHSVLMQMIMTASYAQQRFAGGTDLTGHPTFMGIPLAWEDLLPVPDGIEYTSKW